MSSGLIQNIETAHGDANMKQHIENIISNGDVTSSKDNDTKRRDVSRSELINLQTDSVNQASAEYMSYDYAKPRIMIAATPKHFDPMFSSKVGSVTTTSNAYSYDKSFREKVLVQHPEARKKSFFRRG